jgi:hypothetical protein
LTPARSGGGPRRYQTQEDDPPGTSRLFIAVPVADEVRDEVGALMEAVTAALGAN